MIRWVLVLCSLWLLSGCTIEKEGREGQFIVPPECRVTTENDFKDLRSRQQVVHWLAGQGVRMIQVGETTTLSIPVKRLFTSINTINRKKSNGQLVGQELILWVSEFIKSYATGRVEVRGQRYATKPNMYKEGFVRQQAEQIRQALVRHRIDKRLVYSSARLIPEHERHSEANAMGDIIQIRFQYLNQSERTS